VHIDTLTLETMDGLRLEGDLSVPDRCVGAAIVCHPHPLYGGDRFNPVVEAMFRACVGAGLATIRFDFRGVNNSEGTHGGGVDERMDSFAAVEVAESYAGDGLLLVAGYSFGSLVALDTIHPRIDAWLAVAPPVARSTGLMTAAPASASDPRPKLLLLPAHDQFSPPDGTREATSDWANATIDVVDMADHFLSGRLADVAERTTTFVSGPAAR
jgi:hypothetical protein